jgi:hypothetical protein
MKWSKFNPVFCTANLRKQWDLEEGNEEESEIKLCQNGSKQITL